MISDCVYSGPVLPTGIQSHSISVHSSVSVYSSAHRVVVVAVLVVIIVIVVLICVVVVRGASHCAAVFCSDVGEVVIVISLGSAFRHLAVFYYWVGVVVISMDYSSWGWGRIEGILSSGGG